MFCNKCSCFCFDLFLGLQIFNQISLIFIAIVVVDYQNLKSETKENENQIILNIFKPNKHENHSIIAYMYPQDELTG